MSAKDEEEGSLGLMRVGDSGILKSAQPWSDRGPWAWSRRGSAAGPCLGLESPVRPQPFRAVVSEAEVSAPSQAVLLRDTGLVTYSVQTGFLGLGLESN